MGLRDLKLRKIYDSSETHLVDDLMVPCLCESKAYLRGVGFFSSGWLRIASKGLLSFVENSGKATFIISPLISEADWQALQLGEEAKQNEILKQSLSESIKSLHESLEDDLLNAFAWMVADGFLEFLFAVPRDRESECDYHDKVGLFIDSGGDKVAFHGSYNDSIKGSLNGEAFSVFCSWENGQIDYVLKHEQRLCALKNDQNSQFKIFSIPEAIKDDFIKLRLSDRPYSIPDKAENSLGTEKLFSQSPISLRDYQKKAISSWIANSSRGIFEMATGTGKTFTALAAAKEAQKIKRKLSIVILVPFLHLVDQWDQETRKFGFEPVLCSSDHGKWKMRLSQVVDSFNLGVAEFVCIISTHASAILDSFQKHIARLKGEHLLLIADEVHGLGAPNLRNALTDIAHLRLGLSATPWRWMDDEGTQYILNYFDRVVFEYPLEQAIGIYLTPYKYYPKLVELKPYEMDDYIYLSQKIALLQNKDDLSLDEEQNLKLLLIKRARIINEAESKFDTLGQLISQLKNDLENSLSHLLFYSPSGRHKDVLKLVAKHGIKAHEFVHTVSSKERSSLLSSFDTGELEALVAVKCLDEGVDVPSTRTAVFLASTTNPREFIQRRGRILRLAKGKSKAIIFDMIAIPPRIEGYESSDYAKNIFHRELPRFAEFSRVASNQFEAREVIKGILDKYGVLHLMELRPWEIYHSAINDVILEQTYFSSDPSSWGGGP